MFRLARPPMHGPAQPKLCTHDAHGVGGQCLKLRARDLQPPLSSFKSDIDAMTVMMMMTTVQVKAICDGVGESGGLEKPGALPCRW